jgi:MFS family permease
MTISRAHKIALLGALYLAQGLPYGFFTQALPVLLRDSGYSLKAISATSLLYLPWALKFLWAPYLDHVGTRRQWLLLWQLSSVAGALLLTQVDLGHDYTIVLAAAFAFNFIAASQDIVTDGLAVRMLDARERGLANAIQVGAYRLGMIIGGGLLLLVFARTNWATMFFGMAAVLALTVLPVLPLVEPPRVAGSPAPALGRLSVGWIHRLLMPGMLRLAGLIFCYRFGDAMISKLLGPFLRDQGLTLETIALMKGVVGSGTSLAGALLGGLFAFRVGRRSALLYSGLGQGACFVLYVVAASGIGGMGLLWTATICEGIVGTMATVALFTLMMDASDPEHAGTDYTLLASVVVLVDSAGNFVAAAIGDAFGYAVTFATGLTLAVAGCLVLVFSLDRKPAPHRVAEVWSKT